MVQIPSGLNYQTCFYVSLRLKLRTENSMCVLTAMCVRMYLLRGIEVQRSNSEVAHCLHTCIYLGFPPVLTEQKTLSNVLLRSENECANWTWEVCD